MWGVEGGGGLIVLCRCGTVCKQIKVHTLWLQEGCQNWLAGSVSIEEFIALRTPQWTQYLLTSSDNLPAATAQNQHVAKHYSVVSS